MMQNLILTVRSPLYRRAVLAMIASASLVSRSLAAEAPQTSVLVISSTHKRLATNTHYNYADLYNLVADFHPDLVGVEIRQTDLGQSAAYLHHNYPQEMIALNQTYKDRVFGFDWLGEELNGQRIPDDWWTKRSPIKQLERACAEGPSNLSQEMMRLNARLEELSREQDDIVKTATGASLADGHYDHVTADYYQTAAKLTRGTFCQRLSEWYAARDHHISTNIVAEVLRNPGRRIAVITGADHHGPVVKALAKLGSSVKLVPVNDPSRISRLPH